MKENKIGKEVQQLEFSRTLQDYQIAFNSLVTFWVALIVGLIIAYITERLVFGVFFVTVIGISAYVTTLTVFYLLSLRDELEETITLVKR